MDNVGWGLTEKQRYIHSSSGAMYSTFARKIYSAGKTYVQYFCFFWEGCQQKPHCICLQTRPDNTLAGVGLCTCRLCPSWYCLPVAAWSCVFCLWRGERRLLLLGPELWTPPHPSGCCIQTTHAVIDMMLQKTYRDVHAPTSQDGVNSADAGGFEHPWFKCKGFRTSEI